MTSYEQEKARLLTYRNVSSDKRLGQSEELRTSPLLSLAVRHNADPFGQQKSTFPQYGLLGYNLSDTDEEDDPEPLLLNIDAPHSTFICGSQGGGKSYTLAVMLENCLLRNKSVNRLLQPLSGLVFHYDNDSNLPSEAATLCSMGLKVRVLASPSNLKDVHARYRTLRGGQNSVTFEPLLFRDSHLDPGTMKKLMAFSDQEGTVPLYMEIIEQKLRHMKIAELPFTFKGFRKDLDDGVDFNAGQRTMMNMRLNLLESFMDTKPVVPGEADIMDMEPGTLTIVDLSDTSLDPSSVCMLFDACLGLALRRKSAKIIALDEAHKYLNKSAAAEIFTERLLSTIRLQRHNGTRVVISTQEPTISPSLLDLCNTSIIHHFKSPAWFAAIRDHLGGASTLTTSEEQREDIFKDILDLQLGQSLVFSPASYVHIGDKDKPRKLGSGMMKMQTRLRLTTDIGKSDMASRGLA